MAALDDVLGALGLEGRAAPDGGVAGSALLASPLPVVACATAAVIGYLMTAADLAEARTGTAPAVSVDPGHVTAAVLSERLLRHADGRRLEGFAPLSRLWAAADGWVRTHANYPWHRQALLAAFDVDADDDVTAAELLTARLARLPAEEVEDRAYRSGALAVAARTEAQWRASPAGGTPLVDRTVLTTTAPPLEPAAAGSLPAAGIRVVDLTRVIAGPVGTRSLAAVGADVLRIDAPGRPELPLHAVDGVVGKASASLDVSTADGRAAVERLLGEADLLVTSYRPGALRRLGLEADQVAERHPQLSVVTLSAWGPGPWAARRGFDSLVQIASGIGWATSSDGERPGALPCQLLDHASGYLVAAAGLTALARRARSGTTVHARVSLARTATWLLDQPREPVTAAVAPAVAASLDRLEALTAPYLVDLGDGWRGVAPPGRLDGRPLGWPHLPPRYGAARPGWL